LEFLEFQSAKKSAIAPHNLAREEAVIENKAKANRRLTVSIFALQSLSPIQGSLSVGASCLNVEEILAPNFHVRVRPRSDWDSSKKCIYLWL